MRVYETPRELVAAYEKGECPFQALLSIYKALADDKWYDESPASVVGWLLDEPVTSIYNLTGGNVSICETEEDLQKAGILPRWLWDSVIAHNGGWYSFFRADNNAGGDLYYVNQELMPMSVFKEVYADFT